MIWMNATTNMLPMYNLGVCYCITDGASKQVSPTILEKIRKAVPSLEVV